MSAVQRGVFALTIALEMAGYLGLASDLASLLVPAFGPRGGRGTIGVPDLPQPAASKLAATMLCVNQRLVFRDEIPNSLPPFHGHLDLRSVSSCRNR